MTDAILYWLTTALFCTLQALGLSFAVGPFWILLTQPHKEEQ